jgi:ABC-type branched-subunit amino acid transport system substrate-binding protein
MKERSFKIGITALFDPWQTAHGRTFLRAVAFFRNGNKASPNTEYCFSDDGASAINAVGVAKSFISQNVDIVVGHFSSDAASAAILEYERAGTPLLMPAATTSSITKGKSCGFRICPSDSMLAARLSFCLRTRSIAKVFVSCDSSLHGTELAAEIKRTLHDDGLACVQSADTASLLVFAGRLRASGEFVQDTRASGVDTPIMLTDDAVSPYLTHYTAAYPNVEMIGFAPPEAMDSSRGAGILYKSSFGSDPEVYFLETLQALEIAAELSLDRSAMLERLSTENFQTSGGLVSFQEGERSAVPHALWELSQTGIKFRSLLTG